MDGPLLESPKTMEIDTDAGKLHIILDPELAPITATQLHRLLKNGVFSGTPFVRYEPNFLVQTAIAEDKTGGRAPMTPRSRAMLRRLPLEVKCQTEGTVRHKKGYLGMGRDDDPNSAVSSFSIFLEDSPHLDGKYTIFGRVVPNEMTLATLQKMQQTMPQVLPTINSAREI
jgi:cyclophilin family peptidyl-prolyl cis-trans isomerase